MAWLRAYASTHALYSSVRPDNTSLLITGSPTTFWKKWTTCPGRDKQLRYPLMTSRSKTVVSKQKHARKQLYKRLHGRLPVLSSSQQDHRMNDRWLQNLPYLWLDFTSRRSSDGRNQAGYRQSDTDTNTRKIWRITKPMCVPQRQQYQHREGGEHDHRSCKKFPATFWRVPRCHVHNLITEAGHDSKNGARIMGSNKCQRINLTWRLADGTVFLLQLHQLLRQK